MEAHISQLEEFKDGAKSTYKDLRDAMEGTKEERNKARHKAQAKAAEYDKLADDAKNRLANLEEWIELYEGYAVRFAKLAEPPPDVLSIRSQTTQQTNPLSMHNSNPTKPREKAFQCPSNEPLEKHFVDEVQTSSRQFPRTQKRGDDQRSKKEQRSGTTDRKRLLPNVSNPFKRSPSSKS